jgi:arsenate reductase (thioredoxin)
MEDEMERRKVLVLCTGNSARSQMAQGLINHFLKDTWEAYSAGTAPSGYVHPLAVTTMADLGIDISDHRSKSTNEFRGQEFDVVITVCDSAAKNCPTWLGEGKQVHIGFPDPAAVVGSEAEKLARFAEIRDRIRHELLGFLETWKPEPSQDRPDFIISA